MKCLVFLATGVAWSTFLQLGCRLPATAMWVPPNEPVVRTGDEMDAAVLPEISVRLLGASSTLVGHEWPRGHDPVRGLEDQPLRQILIDRPHEIVVRLPSGRVIRHPSKATFLTNINDTVELVSLMPSLGPPLKLQEAIALLETVLRSWDVELSEPSTMALARWKTEGDLEPWVLAERDGWGDLRGEDRASLGFRIRPASGNTGWFVAVDIRASAAESLRLRNVQPPVSTRQTPNDTPDK